MILQPQICHVEPTSEEREKVFEAYREMGTKWTAISKRFPNRTDQWVKNCFQSAVKKYARRLMALNGLQAPTEAEIKRALLEGRLSLQEMEKVIARRVRNRTQNKNLDEPQIEER